MKGPGKFGLAMIASALVATGVGAQPTNTAPAMPKLSDLNPGEGWAEHGVIAPEGGQARAWSDPADGCHLALFALPAGENVGLAPMRASLKLALGAAKLATREDEDGILRITGAAVDGLVGLHLESKPNRSAQLLACYWNDREPARCEAICLRTLDAYNKDSK
ncbi:MAG: hypothetical protein GY811_29560 [Myxococcales bacterium]|nr:hypothetical protein [Myxococcales bacterium]